MKFRLLVLIFSLSLWIGVNAQAIGVGVKPKSLWLEAKTFILSKQEFLVINVDDVPAIYQITVDDYAKYLKIDLTEFQLQPGDSRVVNLQARFFNPGRYETNLSIVARPLGAGGLTTGSGVKLPVTVETSGMSIWSGIVVILLVFGLIVIFVVSFKKRKRIINS